jgi:dephospho-CoA kinase
VTEPGRRFLLVGLTGGIATGKSTVSDLLRALGCVIIDADVLAREVVRPGEPALARVVAEFGDVLRPDGTLDRAKVAAIVFAEPERRRRLEAILHPAIRERFLARLDALERDGFDGLVVFDAPVMIESGNYKHMDRLVVVVTDEATQRARLVARDADAADGERRIASQMPLADKARLADYVIDNSGDRAATEARTREVHAALSRDLAARRRDGR